MLARDAQIDLTRAGGQGGLSVLPNEEAWPYAMRVVSDILESNGSSSNNVAAKICGASVSLMDAGVR